MDPKITLSSFTGPSIKDLIPDIARLRIEVFAEYPFLYLGSYDYEIRYLEKFLTMKDDIVVAAFDNGRVVGIATGFPFVYDAENLQNILREANRDPEEYFCFGEFVIESSYRGLGLGKQFAKEMETHVRRLSQYKHICLYTIDRPLNDPRKPKGYRSLADFWHSQGFVEHPELSSTLSYKQIGEEKESPQKMVLWIKEL